MHQIQKMILSMVFFQILLVPSLTYASEIDSITDRCKPLPDLTAHLNVIVTDGLNKVAKRANGMATRRYIIKSYPFKKKKGRDYCNPDDVYKYIRKMFARVLIGQLESYINELPDTIVRQTPFEQSIYRDFTIRETPTLAGMKKMGGVIRIGDYIIGADKFGHFFAEGWTGFQYAYLVEKKSFDAALDYSRFSEASFFGATTTGVYSNADIAVNFNGLRFYNAVTGQGKDPLGEKYTPLPYLECIDEQWKLVRQFDWSEYIDASWDEGLNANLYRNKKILDKVLTRMDERLGKYPADCDSGLTGTEKITVLQKKYGKYADIFINSDGPGVKPASLNNGPLLKELFSEINATLGIMPKSDF